MTWINEEGTDVIITFQSAALTEIEIARDLEIVVNKCIENQSSDNADLAESILIIANATNGYMEIFFGNIEDSDYIGKSQYFLKPTDLYEASNSHPNGSMHFDEITKKGSIYFAQSQSGQQIKSNFQLYFFDEFYDMLEL